MKGLGHSGSPFFQISQRDSDFDYTVVGFKQLLNSPQLFERADRLGVHYTTVDHIATDNQKHMDIIKRRSVVVTTFTFLFA